MSGSDSEEEEYKLPWPAYEKYFESKGPTTKGKKTISVQCKLCLPRLKIISVSGSSSSNIRKHLQSIHPSQLSIVDRHIKEFNNKRKCEDGNSSEQTKLKQPKLDFSTNLMRAAPSQAKVDAAVVKYVVEGGQPFRVVDETYFIHFVNALHPSAIVMCRQTLVTRVNEAFRTMQVELSKNLELPDYVCTTADCWTAHRRSFIGITAHWIDSVCLVRKSASLACRRITGSHTFDKLAETMQSIFKEYKIQNKLVKTVTDNGSNFVKAFRMFMGPPNEEEVNCDIDDNELEPVAITDMLADGANDASDVVAYLPPHQRCASHTLNLVATADASKALEAERGYKKIHRSTFAKCQGLWNKQNQSGPASDCIKEKLGRYLVCPNATRWNSTYNAMSCLNQVLDDKHAQLDNVCDQLMLPRILPAEHTFIKEYCTVMGKVANALDILQGEKYMYMAFYTPTIIKLRASLDAIQDLSYCQPLVEAVKRGVERRFECIYDDENVMAAMLHPFFKLDWIYLKQDANRKEELINKLAQEMEKNADDDVSLPPATTVAEGNEHEYSAVLNFFNEDDDITDTNHINYKENLNKYLSSKNKSLSVLDDFPAIKKLFVKYNTAIPSSAPVERLFSAGKAVFTDKRACLSDNNFEAQLLLKVNNRLT